MLDDFFVRALLAGLGLVLAAAPLGCFVVWRRMAYFGDTLAHAALLGVAVALLLEINITLAVFAVAALVAVLLLTLKWRTPLSSDALLGLLSHALLAIGLVSLAFMTWVRVDLMSFLFGDILAVSHMDLAVIFGTSVCCLAVLAWIWKPLFAATVSREIAQAEGQGPNRSELVFTLLMASVIAIALKIVGVLLITALLIIPAASARRLARTPEQMAVMAAIAGALAVIGGLAGSLQWNTPSGPSIVVAAVVLFGVSLLVPAGLLAKMGGRTS